MKTLAVAALAALALGSQAYADDSRRTPNELVCYEWDIFPAERFKLDVRNHSPLSERQEHPRQTAYSVHGKQVGTCW